MSKLLTHFLKAALATGCLMWAMTEMTDQLNGQMAELTVHVTNQNCPSTVRASVVPEPPVTEDVVRLHTKAGS